MIQDDWTIDYDLKTLAHTAGTTRYTVQEFYSWLMDVFDDAAQMDDPVPMSAQTPREFRLINGWAFGSDSCLGYLKSGAIIDTTNNDIWACFYSLGTLSAGSVVYVEQDGSLVPAAPGYTTGHIDMLIKVNAAGVDIDSNHVTAYVRNLGDSYDHYEATATATGGYNPIPIASEADANDDETGGTVTGCSIAFGTVSKDIGDGSGAVNYDVVIDGGGNSIIDVYRWLKYQTRRENTAAIDDPDNLTEGRFYQSADPAYSVVKKAPFGTFAGGKFFGARGVWVENISDPNNRELIDATNTTHVPPVSMNVIVVGLEAGDRALVAKTDGTGTIDKAQYTLSSTTASSVTMTAALSSDTPGAGTVRIGDTRYEYTSWSGSTLNGVTPDPTGETGSAYIPLVDDVSAGATLVSGAMIYSADFDVIARVRRYGILPFQNTGTVTDAGLAVSAIRNLDGIVS